MLPKEFGSYYRLTCFFHELQRPFFEKLALIIMRKFIASYIVGGLLCGLLRQAIFFVGFPQTSCCPCDWGSKQEKKFVFPWLGQWEVKGQTHYTFIALIGHYRKANDNNTYLGTSHLQRPLNIIRSHHKRRSMDSSLF